MSKRNNGTVRKELKNAIQAFKSYQFTQNSSGKKIDKEQMGSIRYFLDTLRIGAGNAND